MTAEEYAAEVAKNVPGHLYKYKSLAGPAKAHTRDLIINQRLYFPAPADLNDPFECRPHLATSATPEQQHRYAVELVKRVNPSKSRAERKQMVRTLAADRPLFRETMFKATLATLAAAGVYSLSARPLNLLMWPHYADNHRGVCVRFDMQSLLDATPSRGKCIGDHLPAANAARTVVFSHAGTFTLVADGVQTRRGAFLLLTVRLDNVDPAELF